MQLLPGVQVLPGDGLVVVSVAVEGDEYLPDNFAAGFKLRLDQFIRGAAGDLRDFLQVVAQGAAVFGAPRQAEVMLGESDQAFGWAAMKFFAWMICREICVSSHAISGRLSSSVAAGAE